MFEELDKFKTIFDDLVERVEALEQDNLRLKEKIDELFHLRLVDIDS